MPVAHDFLRSRDSVAQFLVFGNLMECPSLGSYIPWWDRRSDPSPEPVEHLLSQAEKELQAAFGDIDADKTHVVPLSGGLDSRLLVVNLIKSGVPAHRIHTATYGVPGALDYEYGKLVAKSLGVRHIAMDAQRLAPTVGELEAAARLRANPGWLIGVHFNRLIRSKFGQDAVYWSGVAGGPVTDFQRVGLDRRPSDWSGWTRLFCDHFAIRSSARVTPDGWDPTSALPATPLATTEQAEPWDQLLIDVRSRYASVPEHLDPDCEVRMPYMTEGWIGFWLSVPPELRHHQALYRKLVHRLSPGPLRGIPVKGYAPPTRWLGRKVLAARLRGRMSGRSAVNYLDLSTTLRDQTTTLGQTVKTLVQRVKEAGVAPWVGCEQIWRAHDAGTEDHSLALTHLASLGAYC